MGGKDKGGLPHCKSKQKLFPFSNNYLVHNDVTNTIFKKFDVSLNDMKKNLFLFSLLISVQIGFAQLGPDKAPYLRFPSYPPVKLLMTDSVSYFTKENLSKKSPVMLMLFNPQCEHCQHETEEMIKNIDKFKDIQIVMATFMPLDSIITFRKKYKLAKFDNITVAQDIHFFLPNFYMVHSLPFLAFYNKKKELISVFEGSMPIEKVLEELKK